MDTWAFAFGVSLLLACFGLVLLARWSVRRVPKVEEEEPRPDLFCLRCGLYGHSYRACSYRGARDDLS